MKGTYRTALEWAKLILSLDPEADPYCMRLLIHQLSLKAREFNWLLDVSESDIPDIWAPPYFGRCHAASHITPSLAFAALQLKESTQCRKLLTESMQTLPWLFTHLFKELSLDAPASIWGIMPRTEAESLFTEMYVLQTKDLWNTPEATALLMETAHTIPKVAVDSIPKLDDSEMTLDVVRFVYLDNTPALMALAPGYLLHRSNNSDSDPLPPDFNIYSYEHQRAVIEGHDRGAAGNAFGNFFNPIAAIRQLIPNFRRGADDDDIDVGDEPLTDAEIRAAIQHQLAAYPGDLRGEGLEVYSDDDGEDEDAEPEGDIGGESYLPQMGMARRLMSMLWGAGPPAANETDRASDGTSTDDEMPDLVEQDRGEGRGERTEGRE